MNRRDLLLTSAALSSLSLADSALGKALYTPPRSERRALTLSARFGPKIPARGRQGMVICGHPLAARIARDVLHAGGNACDALLAASISQTVIEPNLSSITGCFSMLYHEASSGANTYLNGNVNAPLAPLTGLTDMDLTSGRGVAVPGFWAGFEAAAHRFASLPLAQLMRPAIDLARQGLDFYPALWSELAGQVQTVGRTSQGRDIYLPNNVLPPPDGVLVQQRAAETLEQLAAEGSDFFYRGRFARDFCAVVAGAGGVVTVEDFARYEVRWEQPVRGTYRGYDIVAAAAPDIGGVHLIEMLNMVEGLDLQKSGPPTESLETLQSLMLIAREVLITGARYNDPRFCALPLETILSKDYAAIRRSLLQTGIPLAAAPKATTPGSCHLTVVDRHGNIATGLHSHLSLPWQNGLFVNGVSINAAAGHFLRTMPPPGARISVMICPNILLRDGRPVLASGSPSLSLLPAIVQNVVNILDFGLPIEDSVLRPRFGGLSEAAPGSLGIEADLNPRVHEQLRRHGLQLDVVNPWNFLLGAFEGIHFQSDGTAVACGDPRRTSVALAV